MLLPPVILIWVAFFNINLMLPNCYYAHLNHILFHIPVFMNFEVKFTLTITQKHINMKWVSVNTGTSLENFELWGDDKKIAGITFSKYTRFARIAGKMGKRIFAFEKRGFLSHKKLIRNEYGIKMGELEEAKPGAGKGYIEFDGIKYTFAYNENTSGEMTLYDESMQKRVLTCSFNTISGGINKAKSILDNKFSSLLLVLCWYAFQPHNAQHVHGLIPEADLMMK